MLKYLKLFLFISAFIPSIKAQQDTLFLISGKKRIGTILKNTNLEKKTILFTHLNHEKIREIKLKKIYKLVYNNGSTEIINNHCYLERNQSSDFYRKNLERVSYYDGHFQYAGYQISQVRFFKIAKRMNDKNLNRLCFKYKVLNKTSIPIAIIGGGLLLWGYNVYETNRRPAPYHEYSKETAVWSYRTMTIGVLVGFTGTISEIYNHSKLKSKIIHKYNSLLIVK